MIERAFQSAAVVLSIVAVYFYWSRSNDAMFVSAVLAAMAFFLSIRFQVKERNRLRESESQAESELDASGEAAE